MVKSINKLRPKFTTHADGSDAVLFIHELVGEEDVLLVVEVVRDVHHLPRLFGKRGGELGMRVPHRADRDAGAEVEPTASVDVEDLATFGAGHHDRSGLVVRVEAFLGESEELGALGHGKAGR